ncbi:hypothetical protein F5Y19DRAFT_445040 [Xylariaceae sp. FL1651]|nr:hypothetical protein F5Y19DRAFT_445040 [Xylariaceae sp. FL1651]
MADANELGGDQVVQEDEEVVEEEDFPLPEWLNDHLEYWHRWYRHIVHQGADLAPARANVYSEEQVTDVETPAPFPLNLEATWYCGALLLLIITVQLGVENDLFVERGYLPWIGRVLGRAFLTLGIAIASTCSFEIGGAFLSRLFRRFKEWMQDWIAGLLIRYLGWGEVDENGVPIRDADDNYIWFYDLTMRREPIRQTVSGLATLGLDYTFAVFLRLLCQLFEIFARRVLGPVTYFFFSIPTDFVASLPSWLALPTPSLEDVQDPRILWFEYGVPILIQFSLLVFLWLLMFLYMAQAERWAMYGWRRLDPMMTLTWNLIRATAMHLLAYTAYQLVCGIISALMSGLPEGSWWVTLIDDPISPVMAKVAPNGRLFAAILLLFFHWLLRAASRLSVRLIQPLWIPYILWRTRYSSIGAQAYWTSWTNVMADDMTIFDPAKRVISRVAMTALFGLSSSWPARFHLSHTVDDA